jgi:hypothetical protein
MQISQAAAGDGLTLSVNLQRIIERWITCGESDMA